MLLHRWRERLVFGSTPIPVKKVSTAAKRVLINYARLVSVEHYKDSTKQYFSFFRSVVCLIIIVDFDFFYMCECAVGVDVRDGTTSVLISIMSVVMGCIVLGR